MTAPDHATKPFEKILRERGIDASTLSRMAEENAGGAAGVERWRRYWKKEEKRRIVAESFKDGASVAEVARRYGLNANLREGYARTASGRPRKRRLGSRTHGDHPFHGERIVVGAHVQTAALTRVIKALRR